MAAALVAALLAGCGRTLQPPAAVVDGHVISQAEVADRVGEALTDPNTARQVAAAGGAGRRELTMLVLDRLVEVELVRGWAASRGIAVTAADVSTTLAQVEEQSGGAAAYLRMLRARGLAVAEVRGFIEENLLIEKVRQALAAGAGSGGPTSSQATYDEWLKERARSSAIRINPRFGAFDPANGVVVPLDSTARLPG